MHKKYLGITIVIIILTLIFVSCHGKDTSVKDNNNHIHNPAKVTWSPMIISKLEHNYIQDLYENLLNISCSVGELNELSIDTKFTDEWIVQVAVKVSDIRLYIENARKLNMPKDYHETHKLYLESINHYEDSVEYLLLGLQNQDNNMLIKSNESLKNGDFLFYEIKNQIIKRKMINELLNKQFSKFNIK